MEGEGREKGRRREGGEKGERRGEKGENRGGQGEREQGRTRGERRRRGGERERGWRGRAGREGGGVRGEMRGEERGGEGGKEEGEGGEGGGRRRERGGVSATFRPNVVEVVIYKFEFESMNLIFFNFELFLSDNCSWVPNFQRYKRFSFEVAFFFLSFFFVFVSF